MVPATSDRIPRDPPYSGGKTQTDYRYRYRTFTIYGVTFQTLPVPLPSDRVSLLQPRYAVTSTPVWALPLSLAATRVNRLFLSLPTGTKMFQFPAFAPCHSAW